MHASHNNSSAKYDVRFMYTGIYIYIYIYVSHASFNKHATQGAIMLNDFVIINCIAKQKLSTALFTRTMSLYIFLLDAPCYRDLLEAQMGISASQSQ